MIKDIFDRKQAIQHLKKFKIQQLFIEDLNWNNSKRPDITLNDQDNSFTFKPIAEQGEAVAYECICPQIPERSIRQKLSTKISESTYLHAVIYVNSDRDELECSWPTRNGNKRVKLTECAFKKGPCTELLIQRLQKFYVNQDELDNEGKTFVTKMQIRLDSTASEAVVKNFYKEFTKKHEFFLNYLKDIKDEYQRKQYASILMNRLMFIYFIQSKQFLNSESEYLRKLLAKSEEQGKDLFFSKYLTRLFFDAFAKTETERLPDTYDLLGQIPYLNGGLFAIHPLEAEYGISESGSGKIHIPDEPFKSVLEFFDKWRWHLDERENAKNGEINPDVLGYIFEKYINANQPGGQKKNGAYYTKEDITGYISRNTILPFLFDSAQKECKIAFEGDSSIWSLLESDPNRYIFDAVKKGVDLELPVEIAVGIQDVSQRDPIWNTTAPKEYALPTEIWREVVARRQRYEETYQKLQNGEIRTIDDFITYNLNIEQFARDVISVSDENLLRAFWKGLTSISILDPTCGSGAFLFAALNIMEPLYETCINRMHVLYDEMERKNPDHDVKRMKDFAEVFAKIRKHPNTQYFILKSIILRNLYGVDIMEEAAEVCKLRLFLKLVAQVEPDHLKPNSGIEPLPDIDFNIKAGNTLVGYATSEEIKKAAKEKEFLPQLGNQDRIYNQIQELAEDTEHAYNAYRQQQIEYGGEISKFSKLDLECRFKKLREKLNQYLAKQYFVDPVHGPEKYAKWVDSYKPFHWYVEFFGIMQKGGFDVIIGNPPYVEYSKVNKDYKIEKYKTDSCGNLYAFVIERSLSMLSQSRLLGMIVQLPIICTDRMIPLQQLCEKNSQKSWYATFDDRPGKLFDDLEHIRACIFTIRKSTKTLEHTIYTTNYNRWYTEYREYLLQYQTFIETHSTLIKGSFPKLGDRISKSIYNKISIKENFRSSITNFSHFKVFYHNSPQYWIRAMDFVPYFWNERDGEQISGQVKSVCLQNELDKEAIAACLNSSLFYWWFILLSDCRHLNSREIENFPLGLPQMSQTIKENLACLTVKLMDDLKRHASRKECYYQSTGSVSYDEFHPRYSKPIIDEIDRVLAKHYGFSDEELDFIINYDIKYRMGINGSGEADED